MSYIFIRRIKDKKDYLLSRDTTNIREETKEWQIERVLTGLQMVKQQFNEDIARFRSQTESVKEIVATWRNAILGTASFIASIIVGLSFLLENLLQPLLILDILIGLTAFVVFTAIKGKIESDILSVDLAFNRAIDKLNMFQAYVVSRTYFLDNVKDETINFLFYDSIISICAVRVVMISSLENMSNSRFLRKNTKEHLKEYLTDIKNLLETVKKEIYEKKKSTFWKDGGIDLIGLQAIHNDFFMYHKYNLEEERAIFGETEPPVISSPTVTPTTLGPGQCKIKTQAHITDDVGVTVAFTGVYPKGSHSTIDDYFYPIELAQGDYKDGQWSGEYTFDANVPDGEYEVGFLAKDAADNKTSVGPIRVTLARTHQSDTTAHHNSTS